MIFKFAFYLLRKAKPVLLNLISGFFLYVSSAVVVNLLFSIKVEVYIFKYFMYFRKSQFYSEFGTQEVQASNELLEKRAARFSNGSTNSTPTKRKKNLNLNQSCSVFEDKDGDFDLSECHVVGVCQDIEKPYLRLTSVSYFII